MNLRSREFIEQTLHNMLDVPLTHRCLVRNDDSGRIDLKLFDLFFLLDQMHVIRCNPDRAFRLGMSLLPDINDLIPVRAFSRIKSWVFVTSGHVASSVVNPLSRASLRTSGETPCAVK